MASIFQFTEEDEERGYGQRDYGREDDDKILEKAFKEGCEHGYKKAMRELEGYNERGGRLGGMSRVHYKEGFEEKIAKLKEKYK